MSIRLGGYRGQMRDAKDLMVPANLLHLLPHGAGCLTSHVRVHFIENQHWNLVLGRQHRFQRQHHPGQFTRGSNGAQRSRRLTGVGRKLKFHRIQAGPVKRITLFVGILTDQRDVELALAKTEVGQLFHDGFGQTGNQFAPRHA